MGITPSFSVLIISILGMTAGFAMMTGAIGTLTMVVAAAYFGDRLARGSSSRMLRFSFGVRIGAMTAAMLTWPLPALAPALIIVASMLGSIGFASGQLAANERLFRLVRGPQVLRHYARYLARTSGAMTGGQLVSAGVIAVTGAVAPAFAGLYGASALIRVVAFRDARPQVPDAPPAAPEPVVEPGLEPVPEPGPAEAAVVHPAIQPSEEPAGTGF